MLDDKTIFYSDKELINYLKKLSCKEREYYIFRKFYDCNDISELRNISNIISTCFFIGGISLSRLENKAYEGSNFNHIKIVYYIEIHFMMFLKT